MSSRASIIPIARSRSKIGRESGTRGHRAGERHLRPLAQAETTMEVKRGKQVRPKKQPVKVKLAPVRCE